jgi:hypothetical protein
MLKRRAEGSLPLIEEKIAAMNTAFVEREYLQARLAGKEALSRIHDLQEPLGIAH